MISHLPQKQQYNNLLPKSNFRIFFTRLFVFLTTVFLLTTVVLTPAYGITQNNETTVSASVEITASDSDGDGLTNTQETVVYKTDPYNSDTDNDTLLDGWELTYGLNPLEPEDGKNLFKRYSYTVIGDIAFSVNSYNQYYGLVNQRISLCYTLPVSPESFYFNINRQTYNKFYTQKAGIYCLDITLPATPGEYHATVEISLPGNIHHIAKVSFLIDPYGYVFHKKTLNLWNKIICLVNGSGCPVVIEKIDEATVTIYKADENKSWQRWSAHLYSQINPQLTDKMGEYAFFVPEGKYYITTSKNGYLSYESKPFDVTYSRPININIPLTTIADETQNAYIVIGTIFGSLAFILIIGQIILIKLFTKILSRKITVISKHP